MKQGNQKLKDNYSVILSVLSNKTNLILGFSSPLMIFTNSKYLVRLYFYHENKYSFNTLYT